MPEKKTKYYKLSVDMTGNGMAILNYALQTKNFNLVEPIIKQLLETAELIEDTNESNRR